MMYYHDMQTISQNDVKMVLKIFGGILREERKSQKKSLQTLAYEYDLYKSFLSRIENGEREPKLISILTLCEALCIEPSYLFKRLKEELPNDFSFIDL